MEGLHYDLQEKRSSIGILVAECIDVLVSNIMDATKPLVLPDSYLYLRGEDVSNLL